MSDALPQETPRPFGQDEWASMSCDWAEYRKECAAGQHLAFEHKAFMAGWKARHNNGADGWGGDNR